MKFTLRGHVCYAPDEVAAAPPVAPVVEPPAAAPWAADAAAYFGDNADAIAAFDRYQREKAQPYITKLQDDTKEARELWTDLNTDSATTLRDLFTSVYHDDPEAGARYDTLFAAAAVEPPAAVAPHAEDVPEWAKRAEAREQKIADAEFAAEQTANYTAFKEGLKESHGLTDNDIGLIDPFVFQSPDNPDAAVAAYKAWQAAAFAANGVVPVAEPTVPAPPPVLGADGSTSAVPPLATQYTSWNQMGDALKAFSARQAASATPPPIVG